MRWRSSRARELLARANEPGRGDSADTLGLLRRAALMADAEGDMPTAISARRGIVSNAVSMDADLDLVAAFAWLLFRARKHPEELDIGSLMWEYKWIAEHLISLAAVRMEAVDGIIDDLEREYVQRGWSSAAAAQLRVRAAIHMKRRDVLPRRFAAWSKNESGAGSDCAACRRHERVTYFTAAGMDERSLVEASPILRGEMSCANVPRATYPPVVQSLMRLRRFEEALGRCEQGIRALRSDHLTVGLGPYLICFAVTRRVEQGLGLITKWMRSALLTRNDINRFEFFRGASLLLRAVQENGQDSIHLVLSPLFDAFEPDSRYNVDKLVDFFDAGLESSVERLDRRHGNDGFRDQVLEDRRLFDEAAPKRE